MCPPHGRPFRVTVGRSSGSPAAASYVRSMHQAVRQAVRPSESQCYVRYGSRSALEPRRAAHCGAGARTGRHTRRATATPDALPEANPCGWAETPGCRLDQASILEKAAQRHAGSRRGAAGARSQRVGERADLTVRVLEGCLAGGSGGRRRGVHGYRRFGAGEDTSKRLSRTSAALPGLGRSARRSVPGAGASGTRGTCDWVHGCSAPLRGPVLGPDSLSAAAQRTRRSPTARPHARYRPIDNLQP
jgi:hypothetical protein